MTDREKYEALLALITSPGYKLLEEMLEQGEKHAQATWMKAPNPHEMAKLAGKVEFIQFLRNWAPVQVQVRRQHMEDVAKNPDLYKLQDSGR